MEAILVLTGVVALAEMFLFPLMELLANRLSPQAGKALVIPPGEG